MFIQAHTGIRCGKSIESVWLLEQVTIFSISDAYIHNGISVFEVIIQSFDLRFLFLQEGERFSDTSWQIHRQWREGEGPSWPTLRNVSPARTLSSHPQPHQHSYMATPILTSVRSSEPSTNTLGTPSLRRSVSVKFLGHLGVWYLDCHQSK